MKRRNYVAKDLMTPLYHMRRVPSRKRFVRKDKHVGRAMLIAMQG